MAVQHLWLSTKVEQKQAGVAQKMMSKTDLLKHLATRKLGTLTRARAEASGMVGFAGCVEAHTSGERRSSLGRRGPP